MEKDLVEIVDGVYLPLAKPGEKAYSILQKLGQVEEVNLHFGARRNSFRSERNPEGYGGPEIILSKGSALTEYVVVTYGLNQGTLKYPRPVSIIAPLCTNHYFYFKYHHASESALPLHSINFKMGSPLPEKIDSVKPAKGSIAFLELSDGQRYAIHGTLDFIPEYLKIAEIGRDGMGRAVLGEDLREQARVVPFKAYLEERDKLVKYFVIDRELGTDIVVKEVEMLIDEYSLEDSPLSIEELRDKLTKRLSFDPIVVLTNPSLGDSAGLKKYQIVDREVRRI